MLTQWTSPADRTSGLACLFSIAAFDGRPLPTLVELLHEDMGSGYYTDKGWVHSGLAELSGNYGVTGEAVTAPTLDDLRACLTSTGSPLIVSTTWVFPEDDRRGEHLVVVTAIDDGKDAQVCFRDPSSWGRDHNRIPATRCMASYTGRAIIFPCLDPTSA